MSLLIKALEQAEQDKQGNSDGLTLAPLETGNDLRMQAGLNTKETPAASDPLRMEQRAASALFSAKTQEKSVRKRSPVILILTAIAVFACAGFGYYVYLQIAALSAPDVVPVRPASIQPNQTEASQTPTNQPVPVMPATNNASTTEPTAAEMTTVQNDPAPPPSTGADASSASATATPTTRSNQEMILAPSTKPRWMGKTGDNDTRPMVKREPILKADLPASLGDVPMTGKAGQLQISTGQAESPVNLALGEAYRALMAGDDARAQARYRQIVQNDARNVDAMLGLAAIAVRQDRLNDASGWYGKVLELSPRHPQAQAGLLSLQSQADPVGSESRLKSLIAQQPTAAHLYAALGDLFAEQNRWNDAQQAYFQAYHHDPRNPQYAFNLAVSLEQIGKAALALPYYETAASLLPEVGGQINRGQLEQRIQQLRATTPNKP